MKKILVVVLLYFFLFGWKTEAQSSSFGIYPAISTVKAESNALISIPYTLVNNSNEEVTIELYLRGFTPKEDGSVIYYQENKTPKELKNLIEKSSFKSDNESINSIKIYPKTSKDVTLTMPVNTTEEEYYLAVIASEVTNELITDSETNTKINLLPSIASLIFLSVNQVNPCIVSIETFSSEKKFYSRTPVQFNLRVNNASSHFESISGSISIYDFFGRNIHDIKIEPQIITAKSSRSLKSLDDTALGLHNRFIFGPYTAKVTIHSQNGSTTTKQSSFIALPLIPLGLTILVLFFLLGVATRVIKKLKLERK